jgi:heme/copper-type cytochrome/quinol oxidase subunit 3
MQIPYEVQARPDTGLYNAKVGIWLFLASEVMLFGGLFSAYIFLRLGADDGYWPMGLLNVPIGTFNTAILILSSVTVVMAWASLKMRRFQDYKKWMGITILCGAAFLAIKLAFEWPPKFVHFGAYIKKDKWAQYDEYLGNSYLSEHKRSPRPEITGHLHEVEVTGNKEVLQNFANEHRLELKEAGAHGQAHAPAAAGTSAGHAPTDQPAPAAAHNPSANPAAPAPAADHGAAAPAGPMYKLTVHSPAQAEQIARLQGVKIHAFEVQLDEANANPTSPDNERAHFIPRPLSQKIATIQVGDIDSWSAFVPKHSTYFSTYFMITGLHGAHVLGGVLFFCFIWGPGATLYKVNPEHLANRVECAGLFWHFVDLVWIFVFPLFYLL